MNMEKLLAKVEAAGLAELADAGILEAIARKVQANRAENNGQLRAGTAYLSAWQVAGTYTCAEMVVYVGGKPWLKRRGEEGEDAWDGEYQIPGVAVLPGDTPASICERLLTEIFGDERPTLALTPQVVGFEKHLEPERALEGGPPLECWTLVSAVDITRKEAQMLKGTWAPADQVDGQTVDHHRETLRWLADPRRDAMVDLSLPVGYQPTEGENRAESPEQAAYQTA